MRKGGDGRIEVAETRLNLREGSFGWTVRDSVIRKISYGAMCLIQRVSLVAKTGVSECERVGHTVSEPAVESAEGLSVELNAQNWHALLQPSRPSWQCPNRTRKLFPPLPLVAT